MSKEEKKGEVNEFSRYNRYFSEEFKKQKVHDLESNLVKIAEICREYHVSPTAVYKWIYKYSAMRKKGEKQVIEKLSDTRKIKHLEDKVRELERMLGQKQIIIDVTNKMIELTEQEHNIIIKKNSGPL
ncbi:MAG: transposase [Bacteroidia bacterium]|nr:transposase [Bacteroidia bacterium]